MFILQYFYSSSLSTDQKNQNGTFTKLIQVVNIVHLSLSADFVRETKTHHIAFDRRRIFCSSYRVMLSVCFFFVKLLPTTKNVSAFFCLVFTPRHHLEESKCSQFGSPVGSSGQTEEHKTDDDEQLFSYDSKKCYSQQRPGQSEL